VAQPRPGRKVLRKITKVVFQIQQYCRCRHGSFSFPSYVDGPHFLCICSYFIFKEMDKTTKKKDKGNKKNKLETTGGTTFKFVEPTIHLDFDVLYKFLSLLM